MGSCIDCKSRPRCDVFAELGLIKDCPCWNISDRLDARRSLDKGRPVAEGEPNVSYIPSFQSMPAWLASGFIFIAAASIGEALSYYTGFAGVLIGILSVLIYNKMDGVKHGY